ncbi:MAG: hypothetical protein JXD23_03950 [Spirochaetales bacterium]|nr:hypothetical protein [Spirochaetales bacterium]
MKYGAMLVLSFALLAVGLGVFGCANRYADYRRVLENERVVLSDFIDEAGRATDAETLTAGVEKLSARLRGLAARLNEAERGIPELADSSGPLEAAAVPGELKDAVIALERSVSDLDRLILDKEKLFSDPKVKKALEELLDVRGSLGL